MAGGKAVRRIYEKNVKGYVYCIGGGPGHKMQLPKDERRGRACSRASPNVVLRLRLASIDPTRASRRDVQHLLAAPSDPPPSPPLTLRSPPLLLVAVGLKHPFLVFQLFVPPGQHVSFEIGFSDAEATRRRLFFSSSFAEPRPSSLHCQVPLPETLVVPGRWNNLVLHLPSLARFLFEPHSVEFRAVESVAVGATCKLRKIFTLRAPPPRAPTTLPLQAIARTHERGRTSTAEDTRGDSTIPPEDIRTPPEGVRILGGRKRRARIRKRRRRAEETSADGSRDAPRDDDGRGVPRPRRRASQRARGGDGHPSALLCGRSLRALLRALLRGRPRPPSLEVSPHSRSSSGVPRSPSTAGAISSRGGPRDDARGRRHARRALRRDPIGGGTVRRFVRFGRGAVRAVGEASPGIGARRRPWEGRGISISSGLRSRASTRDPRASAAARRRRGALGR